VENNEKAGGSGTKDKAGNLLKQILHLGINGTRGFSGARELGDKYLNNPQYNTKMERIDALVSLELKKNFTSGFLTSLGGIISLPVAIPASLGINWVLQTRMVAAMAYIGGFDIEEPQVRMTIALCLLGKKGKDILSKDIEEVKDMIRNNSFSRLPKKTLLLVNQTIATRLMQAAATKGFTRLSKAIPVMGGVVGGILDYQSCKDTSQFAKEMFQFHLGIEADYQETTDSV
jgi:hypothetical protein